jgi:hypothetical protein
MGDGGDEVGGLLDGLAHLHDDPAPKQEPERARGRGPGAFAELGQPPGGWGRPVACTLQVASQLLGVPPAAVRKAAAKVEPYTHNDGSPRWSLAGLERALGRKHTRRGSAWRGRQGTVARARPPAT